ncbi:hypothetical protein GGD81_002545 [Rhodobium orientis]|nr:phage minor head protein [Rhodobium orientis]MBB4303502.1 hypothetical protein [Rhodobium orientis]
MDRGAIAYRKAFEAYMRKGTPFALTLKETHPTTHYVWRTRGDRKVRPSHAKNNGKIFAWDDPPSTGHPGEEYGCRCWAEPYDQDVAEYFNIALTNVFDIGPPWGSWDFIKHYFQGQGASVTVRQTGHLVKVVAEHKRIVIDDPTRLSGQIADAARKNIGESFKAEFGRSYAMQSIVFSLGDTNISGDYSCICDEINGMLEISGSINFRIRDEFRDPLDIGTVLPERIAKIDEKISEMVKDIADATYDAAVYAIEIANDVASNVEKEIGKLDRFLRDYISDKVKREILRRRKNAIDVLEVKDLREIPGGTPYSIVDDWSATVSARVSHDKGKSRFTAS